MVLATADRGARRRSQDRCGRPTGIKLACTLARLNRWLAGSVQRFDGAQAVGLGGVGRRRSSGRAGALVVEPTRDVEDLARSAWP